MKMKTSQLNSKKEMDAGTDYSAIWKELDSLKKSNDVVTQNSTKISYTNCSGCGSENLIDDDCDLVCVDCGLVTKEHVDFIGTYYDTCGNLMYFNNSNEEFSNTPWKHTKPNDRLRKMSEWMKWSNDERAEHKLKRHIEELCCKLDIGSALVETISDICVYVFSEVKKHDGLKRGKVKDGIICACIMYIGKENRILFDYNVMCKKLGLSMKYVTHAEDLMIELINKNKLKLHKWSIHKTVDPMHYVVKIINEKEYSVPTEILRNTSDLLEKYSKILGNHTPYAISIACLYKAFVDCGAKVQFKEFCKAFKTSMPTISKTLQAMKTAEKNN